MYDVSVFLYSHCRIIFMSLSRKENKRKYQKTGYNQKGDIIRMVEKSAIILIALKLYKTKSILF